MYKLLFTLILLFTLNACNQREYKSAKGIVERVSCEDIWRSSNVLKLTVTEIDNAQQHKFKSRLRDIDCAQAEALLSIGQEITFLYEQAGNRKTALVKLVVQEITIVDHE